MSKTTIIVLARRQTLEIALNYIITFEGAIHKSKGLSQESQYIYIPDRTNGRMQCLLSL